MPSCAVKTCKSRSEKSNVTHRGVSYHRFPSEYNIKIKWIEATGRQDWIPKKLSTICSDHFIENDFIIKKSGRRFLKPGAIPTQKIVNLHIQMTPEKETRVETNKIELSLESTTPENLIPLTPRKRKLKEIISTKETVIKRQRLQIKRIQAQNRRLKKKVNKIEDLLNELQEKFSLRNEDISTLKSTNLQMYDLISRHVNKDKSGKITTAPFSPALRTFALTLHYYSPKAYNYVRSTFNTCLPHPRTIKKWYETVHGEPGFTKESLEALKLKCSSSKYPIIANLVMDEMAIRRRIEWDGNNLHGYVDIGNGIKSDLVAEAKEALVFLVTAVNASWKIPVGYFLVDGITGMQRADLMKQCLEFIHTTGVQIISLTFDGCAANIAMLKYLECSLEDVKFKHPVTNNLLVCVLDPSHLIKLIRNAFESYKTFIDADGNRLDWNFLDKLNQLQENEKFHLANKLRFQHIHFYNQKMKVKLATQLFSLSVADAIDFCRNDLQLLSFQDSGATGNFLRIMNNLFDIFNSRSMHHPGFKKALNSNNAEIIFDYLTMAVDYISTLKCVDGTYVINSSRNLGFNGFIACAKALKHFYSTLIETKVLVYFPFYKVSQDHLELLFCNIRSHGGTNNNPTARQFKAAYKKLLVHIEVRDLGRGNCTELEKISILNCSSAIKRINSTTSGNDYDIDDDENYDNDQEKIITFCESLSELSVQIISHIAGNIVHTLMKKIQCDTCVGALLSNNINSLHKFIIAKDKGGLLYPSEDVVKICKASEAVIRSHIDDQIKINKEVLLIKILRNFVGTEVFSDISFHQIGEFPGSNHVTDLIKAIIDKYINIRLHFLLKKSNRLTKRQLLNKYILFQGQ